MFSINEFCLFAKSDLTIPTELQDLITVLQFQLPSEEEISQEEMKRMENELKELGYLDEDENLTSDDVNSNK